MLKQITMRQFPSFSLNDKQCIVRNYPSIHEARTWKEYVTYLKFVNPNVALKTLLDEFKESRGISLKDIHDRTWVPEDQEENELLYQSFIQD